MKIPFILYSLIFSFKHIHINKQYFSLVTKVDRIRKGLSSVTNKASVATHIVKSSHKSYFHQKLIGHVSLRCHQMMNGRMKLGWKCRLLPMIFLCSDNYPCNCQRKCYSFDLIWKWNLKCSKGYQYVDSWWVFTEIDSWHIKYEWVVFIHSRLFIIFIFLLFDKVDCMWPNSMNTIFFEFKPDAKVRNKRLEKCGGSFLRRTSVNKFFRFFRDFMIFLIGHVSSRCYQLMNGKMEFG